MSKLNNISGELLAIAYLPKEKRNSALADLSVIIGAYPKSEITDEQKALLQEIIAELIQENSINTGIEPKTTAKPRVSKKNIKQVEVTEPQIVQNNPKVIEKQAETITSIEDIDDAF
jgi:hypothetical protein